MVNITIPDSVTFMIVKIVIPESVQKIGEHAFERCDYLEQVVLPLQPINIEKTCTMMMEGLTKGHHLVYVAICLKLKTERFIVKIVFIVHHMQNNDVISHKIKAVVILPLQFMVRMTVPPCGLCGATVTSH